MWALTMDIWTDIKLHSQIVSLLQYFLHHLILLFFNFSSLIFYLSSRFVIILDQIYFIFACLSSTHFFYSISLFFKYQSIFTQLFYPIDFRLIFLLYASCTCEYDILFYFRSTCFHNFPFSFLFPSIVLFTSLFEVVVVWYPTFLQHAGETTATSFPIYLDFCYLIKSQPFFILPLL